MANVEAVVIHGQTTPLLLGQSALKRLGRYSISGGNLILGDNTNLSNGKRQKSLTEEEWGDILKEALEAYLAEAYNVASEKFSILRDDDVFWADCTPNLKKIAADSYYYAKHYEKAREVYMSYPIHP